MAQVDAKTFLADFDITGIDHVEFPIAEDHYIKFMSDGSKCDAIANDTAQCDMFEAWLKKNKFGYVRHRERAIRNMDDNAIAAIDAIYKKHNLE